MASKLSRGITNHGSPASQVSSVHYHWLLCCSVHTSYAAVRSWKPTFQVLYVSSIFHGNFGFAGSRFYHVSFVCCCSFIVFSFAWTLHNCNLNVHIICSLIDLLSVIIFWLSSDTAIMTACLRQREGSCICRVGEGSADQRSDIPVEWIHLRLLCRHFQGKCALIDWQVLISFYPHWRKTTWLTFHFGQHGHVVQPVSTVP